MKLLDYLENEYGVNEPIFLEDLKIAGMSESNIRQQLKRLVDNDKLARFDRGIYYIPIKTEFGNSLLNSYKVITKKYIGNEENKIGFFSHKTLLNKYGFSTQVPNVLEIVTNKEASKHRRIKIRNNEIRLRRPKLRITNENANSLMYLSLIEELTFNGYVNEEDKNKLKTIFIDLNLSKNDLLTFSTEYPKRVSSFIKERMC